MTPKERWEAWWSWIAVMPTTNLKLFSVMTLDWATAFVTYYMFIRRIEPSGAYDAWLVFLAGLNGFAVGQFGVKRSTDMGYAAAKNSGQPDIKISGNQPDVTIEQTAAAPAAAEPDPVVAVMAPAKKAPVVDTRDD